MKKVFNLSKSLEEGISKTISTAKNNIGQLRYEVIPISRVNIDPNNPRMLSVDPSSLKNEVLETDPLYEKKKDEIEKLQSLANSIKKVGVRHAIEVYKNGSNYNLISGERRVLASILAGKEEIQARILDNNPTELDLKLLQWIENIEREDLNLNEKIENVAQLIKAYTSGNNGEKVNTVVLSEILGCSRQHAATLLAILDAPPLVTDYIKQGKVTNLEKAALLSRTKDSTILKLLLDACLNGFSLENLKKLATNKDRNRENNKKGRPITRIKLGYTSNTLLIKRIIESILSLENYSHYRNGFVNIKWESHENVNYAFKKLISVMEKVENNVNKG